MLNGRFWLLVPTAMLAAACGRGDSKALDDGLKNDLTLAAQAQQAQPFVSPQEAGYANAPNGAAGYGTPQRYQTVERAPVYAPATAHRTVRRSTSRGTSSGTYYPAPAPEPVRNTKRDAGIGAAAGAVIGATTSRDKIKGAIIGAAAGGILGGIIGHTVDVDKRP